MRWSRAWVSVTKASPRVADPPDGSAEPARRPADDDLLGIVLALVAEPAADVGGDHPDLAVGHAELGRHRPADQMDRLGGVVERDRPGDGIVGGDRRARLQRGAGDAVVVDVDLDGARGRFHRAAGRRLVSPAPDVADIARRLVVQHGFGADGRARAYRGGQRRVANVDQFGRVVRGGLRLGEHRGDRFPDMPDPAARERPARRLRHRRSVLGRDLPEARHRTDPVFRHVGAGQHRRDARNGRCPRPYRSPISPHAHGRTARSGNGARRGRRGPRHIAPGRSGSACPPGAEQMRRFRFRLPSSFPCRGSSVFVPQSARPGFAGRRRLDAAGLPMDVSGRLRIGTLDLPPWSPLARETA